MTLIRYLFCTFFVLLSLVSKGQTYPALGRIESVDNSFKKIIDPDQVIQILADSMTWAEGPVWVPEHGFLLCSDPTRNTIYKWSVEDGFQPFLIPSGYTGLHPYSSEPGSNGLLINHMGELVACEHGDRRISKMSLSKGGKVTLADSWNGKRLNSPNDICQHSDGSYFFTDPPYGLPDREKDTIHRGRAEDGVYKITPNGKVEQVISDLQRPNGIAFSPDESVLYVALSDPKKPHLLAYPFHDGKIVGDGKVLFDFTKQFSGEGAVPDGFKVDGQGNIFVGAGKGVAVISKEGKLLGRIYTGVATANCAFGDDNWLYITASNFLLRVKLNTSSR
ncbi:SMP-30/gluconolactonase/LRE family protein [Sphingobacterium corticibacter]|uniref:Gluconolactonase n=1 Tax=Sphingobacterium corticibacter TaxID=2171749 RepID=A0A2T8HIY4_9SPHI|nr:SMP-30/gluconolactonase/LRE family protein [Sphingobacterium corticibacter]PVH25409.1 gluconolactonase [Sphingobacterium corticibacter]